VTIPTNPDYRSLNLAQAVAILCYETMLARGGERRPIKPPRRPAPPASAALLARLFADWQRALWAIDFFKTRQTDHVMRGFRELIYRAEPDVREASLVRAMGIEVVRYLERAGHLLPPEAPPAGSTLAGPDTEPPDA
jgi:tRNA C32,U32 (ribose-2'-O)-methylase TrmJ